MPDLGPRALRLAGVQLLCVGRGLSGRSTLAVVACFLFFAPALAPLARGQGLPGRSPGGCRDDIVGAGQPGYEGYKIRSVRLAGRYLSLSVPAPGTPYSPEIVTGLNDAFHAALEKERVREDVEGATEFQILNAISAEKGAEISLLLVTPCVRVAQEVDCMRALGASSPKCVDITLWAFSLRLGTATLWKNLLNNSRDNRPTFFSRVPAPLLALNPRFGADYDRKFGFSSALEVSSNLLDLPKNLKRAPLSVRPTRLDVIAQGRKSLHDAFYKANTKLSLSRRLPGAFDTVALETSFGADHEPLGQGDYLRNAATIGGSLKLRLNAGPFSNVTFGGHYVGSSHRFSRPPGASSENTRENAFIVRLMFDGHLAGGFSRLALWADGGTPEKLPGTYRRLAGLLGYAHEFLVAPSQTISLEALVGGGRAWGTLPQYARFFGGNSAKNFLYESRDSPPLTGLPAGPLLRSLGSGQAATGPRASGAGGTSYWHLNLNVSFPVPKWSRPLVPDITIEGLPRKDANCKVVRDGDGNPIFEARPLKTMLKNQGGCSRRMLQKVFEKEGLSPAQAQAKAERELKGINSVLGFLADRANLVSVKPLLMFDAARMRAAESPENRTRLALGGGLQLTVVVAKFEAGYLRAVRRLPGDVPGNFVVRLVFQNLF